MNRQLCTYSMVSAFYNKGADYIDSFWPFVISVLISSRQRPSIEELQKLVADKTGLSIPIHSLNTILTRAKRRGYISLSKNTLSLTDKGQAFKDNLEQEQDAQRRINYYVDDLRHFLSSEMDLGLDSEEIGEHLNRFIRDNVEYFLRFVLPSESTSHPEQAIAGRDEVETGIIRHFSEVDKKKPDMFSIIRDMIFGSTISYLLQSESLPEANRHIENTTVVLDTNIAFSILGLHFREFNLPAQELLSLLKREKCFRLAVFDFTVQEMIRVLSRYSQFEHFYTPAIEVGSIYSSLKVQGWTSAKIRGLITQIEDKLESLGIRILTTGNNLDKASLDPEKAEKLAKYKKPQSPWNQLHDISAIEQVRTLRKYLIRRIEKAGYLFLTSDIRLANYNYNEDGHRINNTVCEVIPDRLLANLLWLKNPKLYSDIPLRTIIAMHSRDLFIDRRLWESFFTTVQGLRSNDQISDQDVAVLLYDQQVVGLLRHESKQEEVSKADWILARLEEAKGRLDCQKRADLEGEVEKVKAQLESQVSSAEQKILRDKNDEIMKAINEEKEKIAKEAGQFAKRATNVLGLASIIIVVGMMYLIFNLIIPRWPKLEPYIIIGNIFFSIIWSILVGMKWIRNPISLHDRIMSSISGSIYKKKLNRSKLEAMSARLFGS